MAAPVAEILDGKRLREIGLVGLADPAVHDLAVERDVHRAVEVVVRAREHLHPVRVPLHLLLRPEESVLVVAVGKIEVDLFAARLFRQLLDAAEDAAFKIWRAEAVDSVVNYLVISLFLKVLNSFSR